MKAFASLFTLILGFFCFCQPNTEVYLFDLIKSESGQYNITNPVNISDNAGYDNQPSFWPDGNSIIYARTVDGQTDIARYYIGSGKTKLITNTPQGSEYSPTPTPDGNISSIRLDTTGLQLLYKYDLSGNSEILVEELVIGYHAWLGKSRLAAFILGEPNTLHIVDVKKGKNKKVAENIGRSLHKIPGFGNLSFLDKSKEQWVIKGMDPRKESIVEISIALEGAEDYCWTPSGELLMGKDSKIWIRKGYEGWEELFDIQNYGLNGITRMTVSPDGNMIAMVLSK